MRLRLSLLIILFLADRLLKNIIWFSVPRPNFSGEAWFIQPILNSSIAFSLPMNDVMHIVYTPVVVLIILVLLRYTIRLFKSGDRVFLWWGFIMIGALSNALDRATLGGVLDYLDVRFWPVFNVSDVYITIGVFMIILHEVFMKRVKQPAG